MYRSMMAAALALFAISGCGAEPQVASAESSLPQESVKLASAEVGGQSAEEFLPKPDDEGELPRTLSGYTLLEPAPGESVHEAAVFKGSVFREDLVRAKPRRTVRAYSLDETIFRIEYHDDAPPPMDDLVRVGLERYGKPFEPFQQNDDEISWIRGGRTLTISYYPKRGNARLAIEDAKGALNAYRHASQP